MSTAVAGKPSLAAQQPPASVRSTALIAVNIPAGPLDAALEALTSATGLGIDLRIPADTASMMHSPGVSDTLTLDAAIARLLEGTSLAFRRTAATITIEVERLAEAVQVRGQVAVLSTPKLTAPCGRRRHAPCRRLPQPAPQMGGGVTV